MSKWSKRRTDVEYQPRERDVDVERLETFDIIETVCLLISNNEF